MKYYFIIFSYFIHYPSCQHKLATDNSNNYIGGSWNNGDNQGTGLKSGLLLKAPDLENTLVGQVWVVLHLVYMQMIPFM